MCLRKARISSHILLQLRDFFIAKYGTFNFKSGCRNVPRDVKNARKWNTYNAVNLS